MSNQDNCCGAPDTIEAGSDGPRLLDVLVQIGLHDHICLIYESQEERIAMPVPSIRMGLDRGEKCVFIAPEKTVSDVNEALHAFGIDVDEAVKSGRLAVASQEDTYLRNGHFGPDKMIRFLADALERAIASGFSGLRVVGDMTWALAGDLGTGPLIEYEAKLNYFVRDHPIAVTCQYDRNRFSPEVILNMIRTHPIVIYGNFVCSNPYYVPPEEFLAPNHAEMEVKRLLANIRDREQANKALRELSRRLFQIQEDERRRLARELHDQLGQALTAVKIDLQAAQRLDERTAIVRRLDDSIVILERILQQVRQLSLELRPPLLDDLGLVPALRWYLDQQAQRAGLRVEFFADPALERVDAAIETACFRVAQEALTNVVRHSRAETVSVELHRTPEALHLVVRDNGIGFDVMRAQQGASLGLLGMRERVTLVGGELDCNSAPGRGTEVHAFFPVQSQPDAQEPRP
jgi:signal transduction histidine kinase